MPKYGWRKPTLQQIKQESIDGLIGQPEGWPLWVSIIVTAAVVVVGAFLCLAIFAAQGAL